MVFRAARSASELVTCYRLVHQQYLEQGYATDSDVPLRATIFNVLPRTTTFVGATENELICTATVVPDTHLGLPMDDLYHDEIQGLRSRGRRLCEVTMLASKAGSGTMTGRPAIQSLFKVIFDYASRVLCSDFLCITINPRHAAMYDALYFKDLGGLRTYRSVNGAPAVAKCLDLSTAEGEMAAGNRERLYRFFFAQPTPAERYTPRHTLSPADLRALFVKGTHVLEDATPDEVDYVRACYPDYDFDWIMGVDRPWGVRAPSLSSC
jgi:hypothetical protein